MVEYKGFAVGDLAIAQVQQRRQNNRRGQLVRALSVLVAITFSWAPAAFAADDQALGKLETKYFEHTYPKETTDTRLGRIEKLVFGESRTGSDSDRLNSITQATENQDSGMPSSSASNGSSSSSSTADSNQQGSSQGGGNYQSSAPNNGDAPDETTKTRKSAKTDMASYPRINRLEASLLGKSYEGESVEDRLSRLEKKAFGAPTTIQDLSERTDRLEDYLASKSPAGNPSANSQPDPTWEPSAAPSYSYQQPSSGSYGMPPSANYSSAPSSAQSMPLDGTVGAMEQKVFGKVETGQSLTRRVAQLEKNVFPNQSGNGAASLTDRVTKLSAALQMNVAAPTAGSQTSYGGSYAQQPPAYSGSGYAQTPSGYGGQQSYGSSQPSFNAQTSGNSQQGYATDGQQQPAYTADTNGDQSQQKQHKGHSFLGGLAKALAGVGSMAGSAMGGMGGMGMGGMGMGGMGMYGSPYGGGYGMPYGGGYGGGYGSNYGSSMGGLGGLFNMNRSLSPYGGVSPGFGGIGGGYRPYYP